MPGEITAVDIVDTDASVITTEAPATEEEIFAEFSEDNSMDNTDEICDDIEEEVVTKLTTSDVGSALELLRNL